MRQAVILVGGKGARLGAITQNTPKPLLNIDGGYTFLDYVISHNAAQGLEEIILLAGHFGDQVEERYADTCNGQARVVVVREPEPAGTAGALRSAGERLDPVFLMCNGDSFFNMDHRALEPHLGSQDLGVLALRKVGDARRYGSVEHENGRIRRFKEKDPTLMGPGWVSGGVYLLRREILARIDGVPCSIETDIFPRAAEDGRLACRRFDGFFIDIGLPDTLEAARRELPTIAGGTVAHVRGC
jgi:NDP-sugar pyrophosphorylase family protein